MKYGYCTNMEPQDTWGVGFARIETLARLGFDFVELPIMHIVQMPQEAFEQEVLGALAAHRIPSLACTLRLPPDIRLTGPQMDPAAVADCMHRVMERAARMGTKILILGSAAARNVPPGFPLSNAYDQMAQALGIIGSIAAQYDCAIGIEPLNRQESNIVITYQSALYLAARSGMNNVRPMADYYHAALNREPMQDVLIEPPLHVHFAHPLSRRLPQEEDPEARSFFDALRTAGYDGGVSLEGFAGKENFEGAAARALEVIRAMTVG